jgi:putative heme-binding domain-containing protein
LIRSLAIVDGVSAQEVLSQLVRATDKPTEPEPFRQVILCGLKLGANGGDLATALLEKWAGKQLTLPKTPVTETLAAWQTWFHDTYPDLPPAELPIEAEGARWTYEELLTYLTNPETRPGHAERGKVVFEKAQCIKCHRYGPQGEGVGPDLTTVSQRFQKKEILQSVLFPSHVISDQYSSKTVTTKSGKVYTGIVAPSGALAKVILQDTGVKVTVINDEISEIAPSQKSAMPDGLFNNLSLEEIADLFAFFAAPPN